MQWYILQETIQNQSGGVNIEAVDSEFHRTSDSCAAEMRTPARGRSARINLWPREGANRMQNYVHDSDN